MTDMVEVFGKRLPRDTAAAMGVVDMATGEVYTRTTPTLTAWQVIAEAARQAHHLAAGQDDQEVYKRSQTAFLAALDAAYPEYGSNVLYNLWLDSMESLQYYVDGLRKGTFDLERWTY